MTSTQLRLAIGAVAAAAAGAVTYLLTQGILTSEVAIAVNAVIAGLAGYLSPKLA